MVHVWNMGSRWFTYNLCTPGFLHGNPKLRPVQAENHLPIYQGGFQDGFHHIVPPHCSHRVTFHSNSSRSSSGQPSEGSEGSCDGLATRTPWVHQVHCSHLSGFSWGRFPLCWDMSGYTRSMKLKFEVYTLKMWCFKMSTKLRHRTAVFLAGSQRVISFDLSRSRGKSTTTTRGTLRLGNHCWSIEGFNILSLK